MHSFWSAQFRRPDRNDPSSTLGHNKMMENTRKCSRSKETQVRWWRKKDRRKVQPKHDNRHQPTLNFAVVPHLCCCFNEHLVSLPEDSLSKNTDSIYASFYIHCHFGARHTSKIPRYRTFYKFSYSLKLGSKKVKLKWLHPATLHFSTGWSCVGCCAGSV